MQVAMYRHIRKNEQFSHEAYLIYSSTGLYC